MTTEIAPEPTRRATMRHALLGLYAQTSLHPGSGTALGLVDLPVQRERHTQWPTIPGSAIKGVARDACRERIAEQSDLNDLPRFDDRPDKKAERDGTKRQRADATMRLNAAFGPPTEGAKDFAGSVSFTDARLLAFPVRSLAGVFAHVTCPAVLRRLKRDLAMCHQPIDWSEHEVNGTQVITPETNCPCLIGGNTVVLEEFLLERGEGSCRVPADWIAENVLPTASAHESTRAHFRASLLVLSDDQFTHFARYSTEIMARVRLDYDTKTVADKALFYEEFLPPETLFYSVVLASESRAKAANHVERNLDAAKAANHVERNLDAASVLKVVAEMMPAVIQLGANQTTGKGFCFTRLTRLGG
jgi:CRISPR-associated protein Cmr4